MSKTGAILLFLFLPLVAFTQQEIKVPVLPYNSEYTETISELSKSFIQENTTKALVNETDAMWKSWSTIENFHFGKDRGDMMMINDLNALHPYFRDKIKTLISICKAKGVELAVVETYRTYSKQNEYKTMGKKYTRSAGGRSKHQYGLAVDVVPMVKNLPQWNNAKLWKKIGVIGESLGLRWGGRWRSLYDPGHFEWTGGLSSYHLASGLMPLVPKQEKLYPCLEEELATLLQNWTALEIEQSSVARKEVASSKMN